MVEHILADIHHTTKHNAAINVQKLPAAYADKSLIYQVWVNLLSNAIKYSGKKELPEVEVGAIDSENETTYYVKDNGAGFSMQINFLEYSRDCIVLKSLRVQV